MFTYTTHTKIQQYNENIKAYLVPFLGVILCRLPEKWRKEIEEIVEEMKTRNREERGTGMKVKKQKK